MRVKSIEDNQWSQVWQNDHLYVALYSQRLCRVISPNANFTHVVNLKRKKIITP